MVETRVAVDNATAKSGDDKALVVHNGEAITKGGYARDQQMQEGTLELTIKKADLTGEELPQFT